MESCSRTLFSAWAKAPDANGEISYDDFGEVTVSAIAMSCFPTLDFPKEGSDPQAFKDFVGQFALTHPIVEDMGKGKVFSEDGIVFVYLHGTVAFQIPNDELSRRLSLAMAMTERRGYLLTWFFAAPHDSELHGTDERARDLRHRTCRQRCQRVEACGEQACCFGRRGELQCDGNVANRSSGERACSAQ